MTFHCFHRIILFLSSFLCFVSVLSGQTISGHIANYPGEKAYLSMLYGGEQYVLDSAVVKNGTFVFNNPVHLNEGVYVVVLPPSSGFLLLVGQKDLKISLNGDFNSLTNTLSFEDSPNNTEYYDYLRFLGRKKPLLAELRSLTENSDAEQQQFVTQLEHLKNEIDTYRTELVERNPGSLTAAMVECEIPTETPEFTGSPEEVHLRKAQFRRAHYFDHIGLTDERLIRAPKEYNVDRVNYFLDSLVIQTPDSVSAAVEWIFKKCEASPEAYKFYFTHIFNKYRASRVMGMDAVFVHIGEEYVARGRAPWLEKEEKEKILQAVERVAPTLIGKKAPDFVVQDTSGKDISLYSIEAPYLVIYFWSPTCSHCQHSTPYVKSFYDQYKHKGVKVFGVCTKLGDPDKQCLQYIIKNGLTEWINAGDPLARTSIHSLYNIMRTPKLLILDQDKTILAKDMPAEQLPEVMERLLAR